MKLPAISQNIAFAVLRGLTGFIFITHGAARIIYWTIPGFGAFLDSKGFMIGLFLAWIVTIGEIIAGSLLALGYKVKYCALFHAFVLLNGIFLVHLPRGWFTVGQSSGGVEYSLLLLTLLAYFYSKDFGKQ